MNEMPKVYMNEAEASYRYGYSRYWFQRERWKGTGPSYVKINGGRILYPIDSTDGWFQSFGLQQSTSVTTTPPLTSPNTGNTHNG